MSLTSYRAAPPRVRSVAFGFLRRCVARLCRCVGIVRVGTFPVRSGGDLLSHVLRRSTIGVGALIGRVRDGIGSFASTMATRPDRKRAAPAMGVSSCDDCALRGGRHQRLTGRGPRSGSGFAVSSDDCSKSIGLLLTFLVGAGSSALRLPDQIKPIGQLVPVS